MLVARVVLSLACVVGLIWYAGRRLGAPAKAGRRADGEHDVRVVGRQNMGRHSGVAVLAIGNRRVLVGYGEQQVTMLTELGPVVAPIEDATPTKQRSRAPSRPALASRRTARDDAGLAAAVGAADKPGRTAPSAPRAATAAATTTGRASKATGRTAGALGAAGAAGVPGGALAGSVLAPDTWRTFVHALQDRTVRR